MSNKNVKTMVETAVLVAAALVLSMIRLWRMPQGGSVSLTMLPILILAFRRGGKVGVVGGMLVGTLRLFLDPFIIHPAQLLLDYPLPFAVVGLAGFIQKDIRVKLASFNLNISGIVLGVLLGVLLRFAMHILSGVIFFSDHTTLGGAIIFSMGYNASFLIPETIITGIALYILSKRDGILNVKV